MICDPAGERLTGTGRADNSDFGIPVNTTAVRRVVRTGDHNNPVSNRILSVICFGNIVEMEFIGILDRLYHLTFLKILFREQIGHRHIRRNKEITCVVIVLLPAESAVKPFNV